MYFAELDENNVVKAIGEAPSMPAGSRFVRLSSYDDSVLGKRYVGEWIGNREAPAKARNGKARKPLERGRK